jgi:hypothetical protein
VFGVENRKIEAVAWYRGTKIAAMRRFMPIIGSN